MARKKDSPVVTGDPEGWEPVCSHDDGKTCRMTRKRRAGLGWLYQWEVVDVDGNGKVLSRTIDTEWYRD
jgi:hypothetical protein